MEWLTRTLFSLGRTPVSTLTVIEFGAAIALVIGLARSARWLLGSRLLRLAGMPQGLSYTVGQMAYYTILVIGGMIALQTSGIEMGSLTVILGALGVGIGFGLQTVVNNFVSGFIMLAERSVQVGDWIEIDGTGGRVVRIGARSTSIVTSDNIALIVPNADLMSHRIINWSHGDPRVRFRVPVGVAYGSDMVRVREALLEAARSHSDVLRDPPPAVFFTEFGDSALGLELAVWTAEVRTPLRFRSDLNFAVDGALRRAGIQIPFPQRDVHFRTGAVRLEVGDAGARGAAGES